MHLITICGPSGSGKTTKLNRVAQDLKACGERVLFCDAKPYSLRALRIVLSCAASEGVNAVFIDDCSRDDLVKVDRVVHQLSSLDLVVYVVEAA